MPDVQLTAQEFNAWVLAISTLINVLAVPMSHIRDLFKRNALPEVEIVRILSAVKADAERRLADADAAAGHVPPTTPVP